MATVILSNVVVAQSAANTPISEATAKWPAVKKMLKMESCKQNTSLRLPVMARAESLTEDYTQSCVTHTL